MKINKKENPIFSSFHHDSESRRCTSEGYKQNHDVEKEEKSFFPQNFISFRKKRKKSFLFGSAI